MTNALQLSTVNQDWHQALDADYQRFLEALTALDAAMSKQTWQVFKQSLLSHINFEEKHIEPLCANFGAADGFDQNILKLIQADHLILNRLLIKADKTVADILTAKQARKEMVRALDIFIKLRNVLIHHDQRETSQLYPPLEAQLESKKNVLLAHQMQRAMKLAMQPGQ